MECKVENMMWTKAEWMEFDRATFFLGRNFTAFCTLSMTSTILPQWPVQWSLGILINIYYSDSIVLYFSVSYTK